MSSLYRQQLESWLKKIHVKAESVLDVGGGQNPVKGRTASWKAEHYIILDNDLKFEPDVFGDLNQDWDEGCGLGIHSEKGMRIWNERVEMVFCLEVMEYIWNPLQAHQNLFSVLKPGGIAYISYPTIYPLHNPTKIDFLRYTKNAVEKLLGEAGFKTWEITPRIATEGADALSNFWSRERMRSMKGTNEIYDIGYLVEARK